MNLAEFASSWPAGESLGFAKIAVTVSLLALFWGWETWFPFFERRAGRWRHAGRNLALAICNTVVLALVFGTATVVVAGWTAQHGLGLLHALPVDGPLRLPLAVVLLDGWMYLWHRANHAVPLLWRFHRMHHSDDQMDVTTATRFHLGEHAGGAVLRLGLIPLAGFEVEHLLVYDTLVIAVTQLHHANLSLGRWDRWLRWLLVTPDVHKVHHSQWRPETNSNYSTLFSVWDRLAGTLRLRADPQTIVFGLEEFADPYWQSWTGMWRTPFVEPPYGAQESRRTRPVQQREAQAAQLLSLPRSTST
jgi:sterol desaturase/sphingolipid hydroxylase (fatty acid hydroxylase superfamily)